MQPFRHSAHSSPSTPPLCLCTMPPRDNVGPAQRQTAIWIRGELLKMDWMKRSDNMAIIKFYFPGIHDVVCSLLSPDEHVEGRATSEKVKVGSVIVLPDCKRPRQVTLHRYFKSKKKHSFRLRQATLHRWFKSAK